MTTLQVERILNAPPLPEQPAVWHDLVHATKPEMINQLTAGVLGRAALINPRTFNGFEAKSTHNAEKPEARIHYPAGRSRLKEDWNGSKDQNAAWDAWEAQAPGPSVPDKRLRRGLWGLSALVLSVVIAAAPSINTLIESRAR